LDLYVGNYVDYRLSSARPSLTPAGLHDYCGPLAYEPLPGKLLHNRGDGTFEDTSGPVGVLTTTANGLGVVAADFDDNGWLDLYIASDQAQNLLWMNDGDGRLRNDALISGTAVNRMGQAEAGMGVAAADFDGDGDGDEDLFVTHLTSETSTFYRNDGLGLFMDETIESGLGTPSLPFTGFGAATLDFDNDGWLDLAVANGAVVMIEDLALSGDDYPYGQRDQLFRNLGDGRFAEVRPENAGLGPADVGRGLALGDIDNDGDTDLLLANDNGPARLLINQLGHERSWIGVRVIDRHGRDGLGARVEAERADAPALWRRVHTDGSFCSAHAPRVLLGLGEVPTISALRVHWTTGEVESFAVPVTGQSVDLVQGTGAPGS
jgi:enediyne biosynthesis protein E4